MKSIFLASILLLISTDSKNHDPVKAYILALNTKNFSLVYDLISDSCKVNCSQNSCLSKHDFFNMLVTGSYFSPKIKILSIKDSVDKIFVTSEETNDVLENLSIGKIVYEDIYQVKDGKIINIYMLAVRSPLRYDSINNARRDEFQNWMQKYKVPASYGILYPDSVFEGVEIVKYLRLFREAKSK